MVAVAELTTALWTSFGLCTHPRLHSTKSCHELLQRSAVTGEFQTCHFMIERLYLQDMQGSLLPRAQSLWGPPGVVQISGQCSDKWSSE